jgi:hypothetical protein
MKMLSETAGLPKSIEDKKAAIKLEISSVIPALKPRRQPGGRGSRL